MPAYWQHRPQWRQTPFSEQCYNTETHQTRRPNFPQPSALYGRPISDFIPIHPGRYQPHPTWRETLTTREEVLRNRHIKTAEHLSEHTRHLTPLVIRDHVRIQNQAGPQPTKWDKTGIAIEVRQFDQYVVRVDGSGQATLRNNITNTGENQSFTCTTTRH